MRVGASPPRLRRTPDGKPVGARVLEAIVAPEQLAAFDRRAFAFTFGRLSDRSRYQRYFTSKPVLTPRELHHLLDVDHFIGTTRR